MKKREAWKVAIMVTALVAGCDAPTVRSSEKARLLSAVEMDQVSAGSAAAASNAQASAFGPSPLTTTLTSTLAFSGASPVSAPPFFNAFTLNYAFSQALASAAGAPLAAASGSTHVGVDGGPNGATIDATGAATAAGSGAGQAQINMQFYGLSIGEVDLAFGTAIAAACCAPLLEAQTSTAATGQRYSKTLQASPISTIPGQAQDRVDISVVSSALPILDAGQVSAFTGPSLSQSIGQ